MTEKVGIKEFIELFAYLLGAFVLVYYVPYTLNRILFLLVLPLVWNSKRDYLWLAFFLVLVSEPGGFFSGSARNDSQRLPIYSLMAGFSFTIVQLYFIVILIKSLTKYKNKQPYIYFGKNLEILGVYLLILFVISILLGISIDSVREIYKTVINLTIFYSIFYIIPSKNDLFKFFNLIFPFVFIALLLQFYGLTYKHQPIELFKPGSVLNLYDAKGEGAEERPIELVNIIFITFTGSLFVLAQGKSLFSQTYLILANATCFISIFLSGTRTWTVSFALAYMLFVFFTGGKFAGSIIKFAIGLVVLAVLLSFSPVINHQIEGAWKRISTIGAIAQGDLSLGGTAIRYHDHAPLVLKGFTNSSIVFGAGFSDIFYRYGNIHVGYHNILLNTGIVGGLLYFFFIFKLLLNPFATKIQGENEYYITANKVAIIPLIILLIVNSGVQVIGYAVIHTPLFMIQAYVLSLIVISYNDNNDFLKIEESIDKKLE